MFAATGSASVDEPAAAPAAGGVRSDGGRDG
jgi:hypothetical protein